MDTLGFLGAGWMGGALLCGLQKQKIGVSCCYYDISARRCEELETITHLSAENSIEDVMKKADAAVISVKPQVYPAVADTVAAHYREGQILLSIMAGITLETLAAKLPPSAKVIRLMPNMAMSVGAGVCLMSANENVTEEEKQQVKEIFSAFGLVKEIPEHQMDAGTALSGSGPAFFYSMIDAMMLGGVQAGFTRDDAMELAVWAMKGAAELLLESGESASSLRDQMMSAGGTTVEGVCVLEKGSFRGDVIDAVAASCRRSKELSEGGKKK